MAWQAGNAIGVYLVGTIIQVSPFHDRGGLPRAYGNAALAMAGSLPNLHQSKF